MVVSIHYVMEYIGWLNGKQLHHNVGLDYKQLNPLEGAILLVFTLMLASKLTFIVQPQQKTQIIS